MIDIMKYLREKDKIFLSQTALHLEGIHLNEDDTSDLLANKNRKVFDVNEEGAIIMRNVVNALNYLEALDFDNINIDLCLYIKLNSILDDEQALFVGELRYCKTSIGCIEEEISVYDKNEIVAEINRLESLSIENYKEVVPDVFL